MIYEADENELMNLVRSVNNHMNHVLNQFYSPYGLTRPQAIVLSEIERHGPVTVSLLAQRLGMTTSNLCLIAQRLEKSGFKAQPGSGGSAQRHLNQHDEKPRADPPGSGKCQ